MGTGEWEKLVENMHKGACAGASTLHPSMCADPQRYTLQAQQEGDSNGGGYGKALEPRQGREQPRERWLQGCREPD